ncbi:hscarg dehydrogenase, putative [Talaromyces stipitatus ATCC 10500]|uniref:Hscarg dehydrogenase, putative n=1 Tax=Talaromyces stipitatus (strain ATCC 10500 / CBS 375.48 / QM 6759 / NRRL 1006) TaxID=441959 RepID=B8LZL8_TALSN|nr:hscarg dehydrogenase, putative [Talaromyces stipitatus ATCC 10500]EED22441.1 hscarg dehydrogenase, putative [Talaromyces stipitatus ATCC 10500]
MASTQLKTVVVFGATGIQGGSVVKTLLEDPRAAQQFKVRAVTRDPAKPAAKALLERGAEVVKADLEDKESLKSALTGAYALFLVTNFFDKMDAALEEQQGKNVADLAKELNIEHFIWSSLPYISKISGNKYNAATHFDHKAAVDDYIKSLSLPYTVVRLAIYGSEIVSNFITPLPVNPPSYGLIFPGNASERTVIPIINPAADLGKFIKGILLSPETTVGRSFNLAEKLYTLGEVTEILRRQGLKVSLQCIDMATFKAGLAAKGLPESFRVALQHVLEYTLEFGFFNGESIDQGLELLTDPLTSFEDFVKGDSKFEQLLQEQ